VAEVERAAASGPWSGAFVVALGVELVEVVEVLVGGVLRFAPGGAPELGGCLLGFGLRAAGLVSSPAIRVLDTSGRTREADLSVSHAPGARVAAVGFRKVGKAPSGCLGAFLAWLLKLLRGRGKDTGR